MTPWSLESRALFKILSDGEWHFYNEVLESLARTFPPGRALRKYEARLKYKREYHGTTRTLEEPPEHKRIEYGQKSLAYRYFSPMKRRYLEVSGEKGAADRLVRIPPGSPLWDLMATGEKPDSYDDDELDEQEAPESSGPDAVEAPESAEGSPEYPLEPEGLEFSFPPEPEEPVIPAAPAGSVGERMSKAFTLAYDLVDGDDGMFDDQLPEEVDQDGQMCDHRDLLRSLDEPEPQAQLTAETVRLLIREETSRLLDEFQQGMQFWWTEQLEMLRRNVARPVCLGPAPRAANLPNPTYRNG